MSPYPEALTWIRRHPGTAGARGLAKLVLSLWNDECAFSLRECLSGLDAERTALALRLVSHFAEHGEERELIEMGHAVCRDLPNSGRSGRQPIR
jgi:hypothetical protein